MVLHRNYGLEVESRYGGEGAESEHGQDKGDEMSSWYRGSGKVKKIPVWSLPKGSWHKVHFLQFVDP